MNDVTEVGNTKYVSPETSNRMEFNAPRGSMGSVFDSNFSNKYSIINQE